MLQRKNYDKLFQFNQEFTSKPLQYGSIHLYQVGEVNYERGFEDTHKQWCTEVSIILSGAGVFTVRDKAYPVKENDIIINPSQGSHTIQALDRQLRYMYLGFSFEADTAEHLQEVKAFFDQPLLSPKAVDQYGVADLMNKVLSEFHSELPHSHAITKNYIENILLLVHRTFTGVPTRKIHVAGEKSPVGATVYSAMKHVDANLFSLTDIRALAKELNFNYSYLSHIFKQKSGVTLQQYIIYKKIEKSCQLICENRLNMTDIAMMLNYESLQAYSKAFKNAMGMSPTAYKTKHIGD